VGNVWVNAELCGGPAKQPIEMPVSDYVRRSEVSNERGDFALAPLPAGEYQMIVSDHPRTGSSPDRVRRPVPDAFLHQKVTLEQGRSTQSVEIRAVPHVVVEIQQLDSAGKPKKTHAITLWGRSGDSGYWTDGRPDADGKILIKAPKGLGEAELSLSTNEHGATRFRWAKDGPLFNDRRIRLGTLSSDRKGLSVIYYTSPIVLVRAAAEDGAPIKEFKPHVFYAKHKRTDHQGGRWLSGIEGDVNFEKQEDGRWRSEQLLPDESFILTVEAEGYQLWSERFSLPEGAIKELDVRLKKR
jgi:hypothetical protein